MLTRGPDGVLRCRQRPRPDEPWSEWEVAGPVLGGSPVGFQNPDGRIEVLAAGADGRLGRTWQLEPRQQSDWWDWEPVGPVLGGPAISRAPVVARNADGRHEVFALDADGELGHIWQLHHSGRSGWSEWHGLGARLTTGFSIAMNDDRRLEIFGVGDDGSLGHSWQFEASGYTGWSEWTPLGPNLAGMPAVTRNVDGRLELVATLPDGTIGRMWHRQRNGIEGWSDWSNLGAAKPADLTAIRHPDGRVEVFGIGSDGGLGHLRQLAPNGRFGWTEWEALGPVATHPTLVSTSTQTELFFVGPDARVHHWRWSRAEGWSAWASLGESNAGDEVAAFAASPQPAPSVPPTRRRSRDRRADVCIIGAGPAGITLADGLIRAGATVVIADSGGFDDDPAAQELNHGVTVGPIVKQYREYLRHARHRQVQGTASGWGRGWCLPFRKIDFQTRSWVENSGWPISAEDLAPYERNAAETFGFAPFGPPRTDGSLVRMAYHYPDDPFVFRSLLGGMDADPELRATAVEFDLRGDHVEFVRFAGADGDDVRVAATTVVLAAGAVENARLLLLHAAPAGGPMVGRCFMEHPHVLAGTVTLPDPTALAACLADGMSSPSLDVLLLDDETQGREAILNASVQLRPTAEAPDGSVECELYVRSEQAPNPDSRVGLADHTDRLGFRWPRLEWTTIDQDWRTVVRTAELVAEALEQEHGAETRLLISDAHPWPWDPAGPADTPLATFGCHHMGTTRMAVNPPDGVVDPDCRVHGLTNVYVAGSSVFPTGGCANPTFTIVTLAHRLVGHLTK